MSLVIGRFAPSPSGPLHFGSLVAALGSYFSARSKQGRWLVRIEDLDPPREMPGADTLILNALEYYGLEWDGEVLYQSQRHQRYQSQIDSWLDDATAYYCRCTRKSIKAMGGFYDGRCREQQHPASDSAIRIKVEQPITSFVDAKHGRIEIPPALAAEDFIIKRRDGLFAYNLAVVLDDIDQGITEVVRGADLIEPTGRQIHLYQQLGQTVPNYLHLPLATDASGGKLSKQNRAPALPMDATQRREVMLSAMTFLGFDLPIDIQQAELHEIVAWGVANWSISQLPNEIEQTTPFSIASS